MATAHVLPGTLFSELPFIGTKLDTGAIYWGQGSHAETHSAWAEPCPASSWMASEASTRPERDQIIPRHRLACDRGL